MIRPPVHKLAAALVIVLPVTAVWLPQLLPVFWMIGGSLVDDLMHLRRGVLDTAGHFLWAAFGLLGIAGLWLWVISPLNGRTSRIVTGAFILLGVVAASPWAVDGVRQGVWQGVLLAAACFLALAVLVALARPNMPPTEARAGERER